MIDKFKYHEVDFLIPVHRFNINFSYVTQSEMSFVREYLLRLIHLSPMMPQEIANYFGFSKIELQEAVNELLDKGELLYLGDGRLDLSKLSRQYFKKPGDSPKINTILPRSEKLKFELIGFSCVLNEINNSDNRLGVKIKIDDSVKAFSQKQVSTNFQRNFNQHVADEIIFSNGWDQKLGALPPKIYSMDSVIQIGQFNMRLPTDFSVDNVGISLERPDYSDLSDSSKIHDSITQSLYEDLKPNNLEQIFDSMRRIGDEQTKNFFTLDSIDIEGLLISRALGVSENDETIPFFGSIYLKENWSLVSEQLNNLSDSSTKLQNFKADDLLWIAPIDSFWGKSERMSSSLSELILSENSKGKKSQKLYHSNLCLYAPNDKYINDHKYDFEGYSQALKFFKDIFLNGNVEIILLPGKFVVVCYHLSLPDTLPITFPIGFLSTEISIINKVQLLVDEFLENSLSE